MDNPAGYRANHRPSVCLQPSVGRRVSTACLINDTDHQYLESKHQKRPKSIPPPVLTHGENQLWDIKKEKTSKYQNQKCQNFKNIEKNILGEFANNLCSRETELLERNWVS